MNYQGGMIPSSFNNGAPVFHIDNHAVPMDGGMHGPPPPHMSAAATGMMGMGGEGHGQNSTSEYVHQSSVMLPEQSGISAVAFDCIEELIWTGSNAGYVASWHGANLQRYTAFRVHSHPVAQMFTTQQGLYVLTDDNLRLYTRFGRYTAELRAEDFHSMQCMTHTPNNTLLVGGHQPTVFELDMNRFSIINKYTIEENGVAIIRNSNRHSLFGDASGKITLRDPRTLRAEHCFQAHTGSLTDFDSYGHQIITCGFSSVRGNFQLDRFLMVYDTRMMKSITPIQCNIDPYFLQFVPSYTSRILVVSPTGQYQLMDTSSLTSASYMTHAIEAANGLISAFDVSSNYQNVIFGDDSGMCHLYSAAPRDGSMMSFNPYSQETQFADAVERLPHMDINDHMASYAMVPMPYPGHGSLLSDWPASYCQQVYRSPQPIDPAILNSVKMSGNIGYAKLPEGMGRPFPYNLGDDVRSKHGASQSKHSAQPGRTKGHVPASPIGRGDDPFMTIPKQYQKVEIKYSKLGVEDFDFRHYNKTHFAGLETHIPNAYCNSMLQVLYFIEPLRAALLNHLCTEEFCLSCELGFLFHMLDISKGMTCQASNFLRAFRTIPDASALGLNLGDDDESSKKNLARIIQNWSRFVLQQLHTELKRGSDKSADEKNNSDVSKSKSAADSSAEPTVIQKLFGTNHTTCLECKCGEASSRDTETFMYNMIYPEAPVDIPNFAFPQMPFSKIVSDSMNACQSLQSWCQKCTKYQPHTQRRLLKNLPDVIGLNCQVDNDTTLDFWKRQIDLLLFQEQEKSSYNPYEDSAYASQTAHDRSRARPCRYGAACTRHDCYFFHEGRDSRGSFGPGGSSGSSSKYQQQQETPMWVPLGLSIALDENGQVNVTNLDNAYEVTKSKKDNEVVYELLASVAHIRDAKSGGNLVAHVHVGETYHQRKEGVTTTQHYLFNDFSIVDIEKEDSIKFNMEWKWPCALFYVKKKFYKDYDISVNSPFDNYESLLSAAEIASDRTRSMTMIPLSGEEKLNEGDVVGIDAEFVSLNQEEAELRSDGTRSTLKPPQMSVARVTCIRGKGQSLEKELHLKPFMDDYISTQEEVVDYLTQFSGIKPGDLDKTSSSKHLTTHKAMYIRLRYMVHKGVVFVGHGLKKDFRVINIVIPPKQVFDTVELFHLPRQRMISLKFLAWYFLGEKIQSDTHDSIEDAVTAVRLYERYRELESQGIRELKLIIMDLYERGRIVSWKVPEAAPDSSPGLDLTNDELKSLALLASDAQNAMSSAST